MKRLAFLLTCVLLLSCSHIPFLKKEESREKVKKEEQVAEQEPKPGDIKVIDGVEYVYARNRRYMILPEEPEYVWVRKDKYWPSLGESLSGAFGGKERAELEKRIAKLEEELKKKGLTPQVVYPVQVGSLGLLSSLPLVPFDFPSPKMRRRVLLLPFEDKTEYKEENVGELVARRLISRLEATGTIICVTPESLNMQVQKQDPGDFKSLHDNHNILAVLRGEISGLYTSTSRTLGKEERETSFAISRISIDIYNTETGALLKRLTGRNPAFLAREIGEMSSEKAKIKAIDLSIEVIIEDLLKTILSLDWHARIASIDGGRIFINAGRLSGLEKGTILEAFSQGEEVVDARTNLPLGRTRGRYKGELEVTELFGLDASIAKVRSGSAFSPSDLVYLKKE